MKNSSSAKSSEMGRPKTVNRDLPPRMSARRMKEHTLYYYRTRAGGKIALGSDLSEAKILWAHLEKVGHLPRADVWLEVTKRFRREGLAGKAPKTQHEYSLQLAKLDEAFAAARLSQIRPHHIRQYLDKRSAKVSANREIALFSLVFNWARERGITDSPNPCVGVRKNREAGREIYVTDEMLAALRDKASPELQDALDLAWLTGQRIADVRLLRRDQIRDGCLWVRQQKTNHKLGVHIVGELKKVIDGILSRERTATSVYLIQTDDGQPLTYAMLRKRFDTARKASGQDWQLRDLRPKAASDVEDLRKAQALLGHASEATTAAIYRRRRGDKVDPVR